MAIATVQLLKSLLGGSNTTNAPITTIQQAESCLRAMIVMIARFHSQKVLVHARLAHDMSVVISLMMVRADQLDSQRLPRRAIAELSQSYRTVIAQLSQSSTQVTPTRV